MNRTTLFSAWAAGAAFLPATLASAVTVTTDNFDGNDGSVIYTARNQDGIGNPVASSWSTSTGGATGSIVGLGGSTGARTASVFVMAFRLPALPAGMTVGSAKLDVFLERFNGTPTFNVDLWGLGYSDSADLVAGTVTPNTTGYFNDVNGDGDPGEGAAIEFSDTADLGDAYGIASRVKLADNLLTAASTPSTATPVSASGAGFAAFIQSLYDAGAVGGETDGDFVLLRLSPDANLNVSSGAVRYEMWTNNDDPASGAVSPSLTIEFVPEPASAALLGLGGLLALTRGRRG